MLPKKLHQLENDIANLKLWHGVSFEFKPATRRGQSYTYLRQSYMEFIVDIIVPPPYTYCGKLAMKIGSSQNGTGRGHRTHTKVDRSLGVICITITMGCSGGEQPSVQQPHLWNNGHHKRYPEEGILKYSTCCPHIFWERSTQNDFTFYLLLENDFCPLQRSSSPMDNFTHNKM